MRLIDADMLREKMYHEAFEKDSQDQRWDSGCWIRYRMFENVVDSIPTADVNERKKGKWVLDPPEGTNQLYKCSVCGYLWAHWWARVITVEEMTKDVRCCPNCYAEMEV